MNKKEQALVQETIEQEGFDYTFIAFSDFEAEVKDPEFHKLRKEFLAARHKLQQYIGIFDC